MSLETFKFCNLKNLDVLDFKFESVKRADLKTLRCQTVEREFHHRENTISVFNSTITENFLKVKLEKEIATLCQHEASVSRKLLKLKQMLLSKKDKKQNKDSRRDLTQHVLGFYEQNLGLRIGTASANIPITDDENAISFVFHNINESNPQRTYSFVLLTDGIIYKVVNCQPPVNEMDDLLSNLNKTNDLHSFTVEIRKCFMNIAM